MAVLNAFRATNLISPSAFDDGNPSNTNSQSSSRITYEIPYNYDSVTQTFYSERMYYFGQYEYGAGALIGGVVQSTSQFRDSTKQYEILGLNASAVSAQIYFETNDPVGMLKFLLSGDDSINGSSSSDGLTGFGGSDLIYGRAGNDTLAGGAGTDTMNGGLGNDTYIVESIGDRVTELSSQGIDLIKSSITFSLVDTDGAGADGGNVEKLTLTGTNAINGTGNSLVNTIVGNNAANILKGLIGNDTLSGSGGDDKLYGDTGNDVLTGGMGADWFVFDTTSNATSNLDTIKDFVFGADKIVLDDDFFTLGLAGTSAGVSLTDNKFQLGTAANDLDDRIIYDKSSGKLYYDADGSGAGAQVQFALLGTGTTHPVLSASDFLVIG